MEYTLQGPRVKSPLHLIASLSSIMRKGEGTCPPTVIFIHNALLWFPDHDVREDYLLFWAPADLSQAIPKVIYYP
jgi:hypothetical protein